MISFSNYPDFLLLLRENGILGGLQGCSGTELQRDHNRILKNEKRPLLSSSFTTVKSVERQTKGEHKGWISFNFSCIDWLCRNCAVIHYTPSNLACREWRSETGGRCFFSCRQKSNHPVRNKLHYWGLSSVPHSSTQISLQHENITCQSVSMQ